ncbi:hypothetical protein J3A83DRAFT_2521506 [Scleroderma citrinum]
MIDASSSALLPQPTTQHIGSLPTPRSSHTLIPCSYSPNTDTSVFRLIFIDFEGCNWVCDMSKRAMMEVMQIRNGLMVTPPKEAMQVLFERLANDPRNEVWTQWSVKSALEKLVKKASGMGIVAENRCFIRTKTVCRRMNGYTNGASKAKWIKLVATLHFAGGAVSRLSTIWVFFSYNRFFG